MGEKVCSNGLGHMTEMAAMHIYSKNPLKIFSETRRPMTMTLGLCLTIVETEVMIITLDMLN